MHDFYRRGGLSQPVHSTTVNSYLETTGKCQMIRKDIYCQKGNNSSILKLQSKIHPYISFTTKNLFTTKSEFLSRFEGNPNRSTERNPVGRPLSFKTVALTTRHSTNYDLNYPLFQPVVQF